MLLTPTAEDRVTLGTIISKYDSTQRIEKNKIIDLDVKNITRFATYKCSIFTKQGNHFLGTASITITNTLQGEDLYSLIINHGSQVFKYNTHGVSPASQQNKIPLQLSALTFTVYDNLGNAIEDDVIKHSEITWIVPSQNTMLQISDSYQGAPDSTLTKMVYKNLMSFSYGINERFNVNKSQNNIELKVNYNGLNLVASTDFTFIKQGASGTNGTDFVCLVVPNVKDGKKPLYPTIYYYNNRTVKLNWITDNNYWFNAELWHNGNKIFSGHEVGIPIPTDEEDVTIVKWEILNNKYDKQDDEIITQQSNFSINGDSFDFHGSNVADPANIIKVTLKYDGCTYYGTLPVIVVNLSDSDYKVDLKENTGFRQVLYSSSGVRPEYDSHAPFELIVQKKLDNDGTRSEDMSLKTSSDYGLTYNWYRSGSTLKRTRTKESEENDYGEEIITYTNNYTSTSDTYLMESNLFNEEDLKKNQYAVKPADEYDGECINIAVGCNISKQDENGQLVPIAQIHIPIHFLRNRFFNSAINGWDGNSVELGGDNGGTILAPQVGAGVKTANNEFTGILIGTVKDPKEDTYEEQIDGVSENSPNNINKDNFYSSDQDVGLFGYHEGSRSIFLDAKTGKAVFGEQKEAQIVLDPTQTKEIEIDDGNGQSHKEKKKVAMIRSGGYWYKPYNKLKDQDGEKAEQGTASEARDPRGRGMMIDLTTPEIKFGSGNFQVDSKGHVIARGGGQIAGWKITDYAMYNRRIRKHSNDNDDELNVSQNYTGINSNPNVDKDGKSNDSKKGNGSEYRQVKMPPGTTDSDKESGQAESTRYTIVGKAAAFWAGKDKFFVTHDGYLRAQNASIGSGAYPIFIGRSTNKDAKSNSAIFSGEKSEKNAEKTGFYLGTDGLGIGTTYNIQALTADAPTDSNLYIGGDPANGIKDGRDGGKNYLQKRRVSNFQVDTNGMFYARTGYIGNGRQGWEIGYRFLRNGKLNLNDATTKSGVYIGTDGISLGQIKDKNDKLNPAFQVKSSGELTALSGHISNWKIGTDCIRTDDAGDQYNWKTKQQNRNQSQDPTNDKWYDDDGIFIGKEGIRLGSKFHVNNKGYLYADSGYFTGTIHAKSGKIGSWFISSTGSITNVDPSPKKESDNPPQEKKIWIKTDQFRLGKAYINNTGAMGAFTNANAFKGVATIENRDGIYNTVDHVDSTRSWYITADGKAFFNEIVKMKNGTLDTGKIRSGEINSSNGGLKITGGTGGTSINTGSVKAYGSKFASNSLDEWSGQVCVDKLSVKYGLTMENGAVFETNPNAVMKIESSLSLTNPNKSLNITGKIYTINGYGMSGDVIFADDGGALSFRNGLLVRVKVAGTYGHIYQDSGNDGRSSLLGSTIGTLGG